MSAKYNYERFKMIYFGNILTYLPIVILFLTIVGNISYVLVILFVGFEFWVLHICHSLHNDMVLGFSSKYLSLFVVDIFRSLFVDL